MRLGAVSPDGKWRVRERKDGWALSATNSAELYLRTPKLPKRFMPSPISNALWLRDGSGWVAIYRDFRQLHAVTQSLRDPNALQIVPLGRPYNTWPDALPVTLLGFSQQNRVLANAGHDRIDPCWLFEFDLSVRQPRITRRIIYPPEQYERRREPALSDDGQYLAWVLYTPREIPNSVSLAISHKDGTGFKFISKDALIQEADRTPKHLSWMPNSQRIQFHQSGKLWSVATPDLTER